MSLTQTKKKTREWKEGLVGLVRECAEGYPSAYVVRFDNFRNAEFQGLRDEMRGDSRFVRGSVSLLRVALGKEEASEVVAGAAALGAHLSGDVGLLFTRKSEGEVREQLRRFHPQDFLRAGACAPYDVEFPAGEVTGLQGLPVAHTLEPTLRKHGMPTRLTKGKVQLSDPWTLCRAGERLTPAQVVLLRTFGLKMARFRILPEWRLEGGEVRAVAGGEGGGASGSEGDEQLGGGGEGEGEEEGPVEAVEAVPDFGVDAYDGPTYDEVLKAQAEGRGELKKKSKSR